MKQSFSFLLLMSSIHFLMAQTGNVGIGTTTPHTSAALDIVSTSKGVLVPRMTLAQRAAISTPSVGLLIFQTDGSSGFYFHNGTDWQALASSNIYSADGDLTAPRTVTMGANNLTFGSTMGNLIFNSTGEGSIIMGNSSYATGNSTALGSYNSAWGNSTAMGAFTSAGEFSTAMGYNTISSNRSTAMGRYTTASGERSTAMGDRTTASGSNSTAIGSYNTASGGFSTAIGVNNIASGGSSTVMGHNNTAPSYAETVIGTYNTTYTPNSLSDFNAADRLFVIGNGTSTTPSNAMTVLKSGNVGIGTSTPSQKLEVNGTTKTTDLQITNGAAAGKILQSDADGNASWVTSTSSSNIYSADGTLAGARAITMGANNLTFGSTTGNLIFNPTAGGNVGIGTTTPTTAKLVINSGSAIGLDMSSNGSYADMRVIRNSLSPVDKDLYLGYGSSPTNSSVRLYSNNTETMQISDNNVGIGILNPSTKPSEKLEVVGKTKTINLQITNNAGANKILQSDADGNASWVTSTSSSNIYTADGSLAGARAITMGANNLTFGSTTGNLIFSPSATGNMGIGTTLPTQKLEVNGTTKTTNLQITNNAGANKILQSDASGNASWVTPTTNSNIYSADGTLASARAITMGANNLTFGSTTGNLIFNPSSTGNVGIGTASPTNKLEVAGTTKTTSLQITNGAGVNKVLQSDASGNASWVIPTASSNIYSADGTIAGARAITMGANNLTFGSTTGHLIFNPTTGGNVGIGTATPTVLLDVQGSSTSNINLNLTNTNSSTGNTGLQLIGSFNGSKQYIDFTNKGSIDYNNRIISDGSNLSFLANTPSSIFLIGSEYNVGIGTSTPTQKLEVNGTTKTTNLQITNNAGANKILQSDASGNASWVTPTTSSNIYSADGTLAGARAITMGANNLTFGSTTGDFSISHGFKKFYIPYWPASGNTTINGIFDGLGNAPQIRFQGIVNAGFVDIGNNADGNFVIENAFDAPVLTATQSGRVGIGTAVPVEKLDIIGGIRAQGIRCRTGISGVHGGNQFNFNWTGSALEAWIDGSNIGTVNITSDRRLKENITPMAINALAKVMQLKPVSFKYKNIEGTPFTGSPMVQEGFIADELQQIVPSAVNGEKDALTKEGIIQPQTLNIAPVVSILTKAMQEQQMQIEQLKAENKVMKAELTEAKALKSRLDKLEAALANLSEKSEPLPIKSDK